VAEESKPISIQDAIAHRLPADVRVSPDGQWAVFSLGWASKAGEHDQSDLWLTAVDGSESRRLTSGESHDTSPRWAPDGATIAFISDRAKRGTGALYLIAPTGGEAVRLSKGDAALADPGWAPDGRRISVKATDPETEDEKKRKEELDDAIVHHEREKLDRLCVVNVPAAPFGVAALEQAEPTRLLEGDWHVWEHAWSPDGAWVAVTVAKRPGFDETFDGVRAALLPVSGGELTWIGGEQGTYRGASSLAWSPIGKQLAFLGAFDLKIDSGEAIHLVDPAQPEQVTLRYKDEQGTPLALGWRDDATLVLLRLLSVNANLWTLGVRAGEPERAVSGLAGERGHLGFFSADSLSANGRHFACEWSDATHPYEVWGGELGGAARQLTHFNDELLTRQLGRTELLRWRTDDGHEIEGQLI
jgi:dipeptidyl aminopeptidase/acylaminoacyl peptidase